MKMSFILSVREIFSGEGEAGIIIVVVQDGELVALSGVLPPDRDWVEVTPTGTTVEDMMWGTLPLYHIMPS